MALSYIISQVARKMGQNPSDSTQRAVLLQFINSAAKELYHMSDMAGCYMEQCFKINANQTIALPDYVGQVRAMREQYSRTAIQLSQQRPRYNQDNWPQEFRNWRIKGLQTLQTSLSNQSQVVISVAAVENPPVVINIAGPSDVSAMQNEAIVMSTTSVTSVNSYNDITLFSKTTSNKYNVIMSDIDGNQISYIACDKLKAQFQIVDISGMPWFPPNINPLLGWVEVLFKAALPYLSNDTDEFPAIGYDDVIVTKTLQLWYEEQNQSETATGYYQKARQMLAQIHEDANRGTDDCASLCEHGHDMMNHRTGFGRDWKYAYRITGR